ncbi:MAG: hypothetical protein IJ626_02705 [Muribaculaceae bacterium]|nr:hypothetical protein [Muribaculaceae bacterium]
MTQLQDINKKMPYTESDLYVDNLVERCTEQAIKQSNERQFRISPVMKIASVAAAAAIVLAVAVRVISPTTSVGDTGESELTAQLMSDENNATYDENNPIDKVLQSISDEDAQSLACISYVDYNDPDL